jgi:hypothetical protein
MAYSEITATVATLQHTHHFHREKMFYYQRLFNARFRPRGIPVSDTAMQAFYQRMFNIHFAAFQEVDALLTDYCGLADKALTSLDGQGFNENHMDD